MAKKKNDAVAYWLVIGLGLFMITSPEVVSLFHQAKIIYIGWILFITGAIGLLITKLQKSNE
jgi:hypothetical protein